MEEKYLLEICNPKQWKTIPKSQLLENGKFPVYGANGIIGRYNEYNHEKPTVLITCRGATCGNIHITVPKAYINGNAMALDNLNEIICKKEYLYYFLEYYDMSKIISGTAQPQITITGLKKVKVKLYSINKQEKIVNELNKINKLIELKERQLEELQKLIKSQFVEMFGDIHLNDKKWNRNKWRDVLIIKNGKNQKKVESFNGKYPIYGSGGIIGFANDYICNENAVIIGRKGSINKPILVKTKFWNVDTAFGLEPIKEKIKSDYLYYFCYFYNFEKHNKTVTIPSLTKKDLLNIEISIPPITLQNQFSEIVKQIDKQKFESMIQLKMMEKIYNIINDRRRYV